MKESEGRAMKKDIEWLKKEIGTEMIQLEPNRKERWSDVKYQTLRSVAQKIYQLDEPEVLSQELPVMNKEFRDWLEEKKRESTYSYLNNGKLINPSPDIEKELQLVIKKYDELHKPAVIPKYVADFIEVRKGTDAYSLKYILCVAVERSEAEQLKKEYDWISENSETFARAWLDGYKVEEEQKYYVINNENYFLLAKDKAHGFVFSTGGNSRLGGLKNSSAKFELTEQEIKDYDERYWAFAELVEEMND